MRWPQCTLLVRAELAKFNGGPIAGTNPTFPSRLTSLPSRLANLSYAQLLEIAVNACESSPELKNKADALIAINVAPLPSWCCVVRGCLAVAGPAAPALQLARALRAHSCGRVHHLVACLQQAAAEANNTGEN